MHPNRIKTITFASLLTLGLAFWLPHAIEKVVTLQLPAAGTASVSEQSFGHNQTQSTAEGLMRAAHIERWLGTNVCTLPDPGPALRFDELSPVLQQRYVAAARTAIHGFAAIEFGIVAFLLLAGVVAALGDLHRAYAWLFGAYAIGTVLGSLFLAVHIVVGIRPNLAAQMGFWTFNLLGECICVAVLARTTAFTILSPQPAAQSERSAERNRSSRAA